MDTHFDLKIATINVRGLKNKNKRLLLANWFNEHKIDILCIQETYCTKKFKSSFRREWQNFAGKIKHCYTDSNHSRGISII